VFYNKSLLREIPKTWNELESLYRESSSGIYPSNLGLGPTYTPNMGDILPLWLMEAGAKSYKDISTAKNELSDYLSYGDIRISPPEEETRTDKAYTLRDEQPNMI
jgi:hypothetical protein